jgi:hypothetical protein
MPATGQEAQFPPLERRGLRVLPTVADRLVRPNLEKSMPVSRTSEPGAMPAGSRSTNVSAGLGGLAVLCRFPGGEERDFADLWPPDAIVSEMTATGFTDVEAERRHVHRERDLAELRSAVGSASGTHNCCHHRTLGIRAACGASNATSAIRRRPGRAPTICAHRGERRHCKIAPIGEQHSPRRGCSARRRFASPRGSRCFSGRGFLR